MSIDEPTIAVLDEDDEAQAASSGGRSGTTKRLIAVGAIVAVLFVGIAAWQMRSGTNPAIDGSTAITAEQLEEQYGVRLDVVGLLASGGLVELSFQVTDADKATALFGAVEDMPVLAVEGTNKVLQSAKGMKHQLTLLDGASYFFLYGNVANAVHEGSKVAFVLNGVRIPHMTVMK
jgi:hypothetical protein